MLTQILRALVFLRSHKFLQKVTGPYGQSRDNTVMGRNSISAYYVIYSCILLALQIFNRFLSGLHLPVGKSKPAYNGSFELLAVGTTSRWIVYMINEENGCLDHLGTLFKALESFYHPSNYGRHSVSCFSNFAKKQTLDLNA